jgi:uncharacterized protein YdhG (YjbR/CyaY superfamily)
MASRQRAASVSEYINTFPPPVRAVLRQVRAAIRKAVPEAEEVISYGIGAFKLRGRVMLYFAGWREHYSLYPSNAALEAKFAKQLAPYELSHKGTIRFPIDKPVPVKLIAAIAKFRAKEVLGRVSRTAARQPR